MTNLHPILCFDRYSTYDQLLLFARGEGKKWRAKFRRKIKHKHCRLIDQMELFENDGVCALFHPENLRVAYFGDPLS